MPHNPIGLGKVAGQPGSTPDRRTKAARESTDVETCNGTEVWEILTSSMHPMKPCLTSLKPTIDRKKFEA